VATSSRTRNFSHSGWRAARRTHIDDRTLIVMHDYHIVRVLAAGSSHISNAGPNESPSFSPGHAFWRSAPAGLRREPAPRLPRSARTSPGIDRNLSNSTKAGRQTRARPLCTGIVPTTKGDGSRQEAHRPPGGSGRLCRFLSGQASRGTPNAPGQNSSAWPVSVPGSWPAEFLPYIEEPATVVTESGSPPSSSECMVNLIRRGEVASKIPHSSGRSYRPHGNAS
jgi:hypothetical protein